MGKIKERLQLMTPAQIDSMSEEEARFVEQQLLQEEKQEEFESQKSAAPGVQFKIPGQELIERSSILPGIPGQPSPADPLKDPQTIREGLGMAATLPISGGVGMGVRALSALPKVAKAPALLRAAGAGGIGLGEYMGTEALQRSIAGAPEGEGLVPSPTSGWGIASAALPMIPEMLIRPAQRGGVIRSEEMLKKWAPQVEALESLPTRGPKERVQQTYKDITERYAQTAAQISSKQEKIVSVDNNIARLKILKEKTHQLEKLNLEKELDTYGNVRERLLSELDDLRIQQSQLNEAVLKNIGASKSSTRQATKAKNLATQEKVEKVADIDEAELRLKADVAAEDFQIYDVTGRERTGHLFPTEAENLRAIHQERRREAQKKLEQYHIEKTRARAEQVLYDSQDKAKIATEQNILRSELAKERGKQKIIGKVTELRRQRSQKPVLREGESLSLGGKLQEQQFLKTELQGNIDDMSRQISEMETSSIVLKDLSKIKDPDSFFNYLFENSPSHVKEFVDFYKFRNQTDKLEQFQNAFIEEVINRSYDPKTKTLRGLDAYFFSKGTQAPKFGTEKLTELFGGGEEGRKMADAFQESVQIIVAATGGSTGELTPAMQLAARGVEHTAHAAPYMVMFRPEVLARWPVLVAGGLYGVAFGYPYLANRLMKNPTLRQAFHKWVKDGATAATIGLYPILQDFFDKEGNKLTDASLIPPAERK